MISDQRCSASANACAACFTLACVRACATPCQPPQQHSARVDTDGLLTRRAGISLGTATQCTRRNDPPRPPPAPHFRRSPSLAPQAAPPAATPAWISPPAATPASCCSARADDRPSLSPRPAPGHHRHRRPAAPTTAAARDPHPGACTSQPPPACPGVSILTFVTRTGVT
jgi:hypothetical protein